MYLEPAVTLVLRFWLSERSTNLKHLLEQYEFIEHSRNELTQSMEAGSAVYQELLQKSQKDVKVYVHQLSSLFRGKGIQLKQ